MSKKVIVSCKLPHGLIIDVNGVKVELAGRNQSRILSNESFGTTEVDADFFESWLKENPNHKSVKAGLIFANSSEKSAKSEAKEKEKNKTGSEQIKAEKSDGLEDV